VVIHTACHLSPTGYQTCHFIRL